MLISLGSQFLLFSLPVLFWNRTLVFLVLLFSSSCVFFFRSFPHPSFHLLTSTCSSSNLLCTTPCTRQSVLSSSVFFHFFVRVCLYLYSILLRVRFPSTVNPPCVLPQCLLVSPIDMFPIFAPWVFSSLFVFSFVFFKSRLLFPYPCPPVCVCVWILILFNHNL